MSKLTFGWILEDTKPVTAVPGERRLLVIDLDGTICEQTTGGPAYKTAAPRLDVIAKVQELYDAGWHITIFTARGMRTYKNDLNMIERQLRQTTEDWLLRYQVPYHRLLFGKPPGDVYCDDRGVSPEDFVACPSVI